jgi:hypothetical protein
MIPPAITICYRILTQRHARWFRNETEVTPGRQIRLNYLSIDIYRSIKGRLTWRAVRREIPRLPPTSRLALAASVTPQTGMLRVQLMLCRAE